QSECKIYQAKPINTPHKKKKPVSKSVYLAILNIHFHGYFVVAVDFIEVHVSVDLVALLVNDADIGLVFLNSRDFTQFGA
ncbi:hypothetical protein ACTHR3_11495, partial [Neisseria sp. P0005.S008]|uniref:hypothetical protein n=1 Tax=Neisseria sp. P0005.S008 TaxID=3436682 RepID=UPI003F81F943